MTNAGNHPDKRISRITGSGLPGREPKKIKVALLFNKIDKSCGEKHSDFDLSYFQMLIKHSGFDLLYSKEILRMKRRTGCGSRPLRMRLANGSWECKNAAGIRSYRMFRRTTFQEKAGTERESSPLPVWYASSGFGRTGERSAVLTASGVKSQSAVHSLICGRISF